LNNPYKEHHHPRYSPLARVPDRAVKEAGRQHSQPGKVFINPERIDDPHATFESKN